jgi:succinate dehydrogenase / fumarate reductase flavoprotein subunit/fumarate reductase flavoprotein subunit
MSIAPDVICDVLILGSGGAGLLAALRAFHRDPRLRVVLASKGLVGKSGCTRMVQGGYNAVLDPADTLELHLEDTLKGGQFLNNQDLAYTLVSGAPTMIRELETTIGCFFDRRDDGRIHQKPFAGQSFDRTVHRGDLTGIEIVSRLRDALFATDVRVLEEVRALDLVASEDGAHIAGALLLDTKRGEFVRVQARLTILATGGGARMYRVAAPSLEKTGDGMAIAWRAGATLVDMEMYQFHPTGLLAGTSRMTGMVLEEGLRGVGGVLRNASGERFMQRYDPARMERSTRDVVARSGYLEIMAGRGTPQGGVYIDVSHLGADVVQSLFPGMVARCLDFGYDLRTGPVEVSPTAHFHMGGVSIDRRCHSSLPGLLVAGEDAGGTHGANRLGGNGVAESTVFGAIAGNVAAEEAPETPHLPMDAEHIFSIERAALRPLESHGNSTAEDPFELRARLEDLMWENVGLVRAETGLVASLHEIAELRERADSASVPSFRRLNLAWTEALDLRNLLQVAELVTRSALERRESRGAHYRSDFPERDDAHWLRNVFLRRGVGAGIDAWEQPVEFTYLSPAGSAATTAA